MQPFARRHPALLMLPRTMVPASYRAEAPMSVAVTASFTRLAASAGDRHADQPRSSRTPSQGITAIFPQRQRRRKKVPHRQCRSARASPVMTSPVFSQPNDQAPAYAAAHVRRTPVRPRHGHRRGGGTGAG